MLLCLAAKGKDLLYKPFSPHDLAAKVQEMIGPGRPATAMPSPSKTTCLMSCLWKI